MRIDGGSRYFGADFDVGIGIRQGELVDEI